MVRFNFWGMFFTLLIGEGMCLGALNVLRKGINEFSKLNMSQIVL